ncbi:hypothetical protein LUZ60_013738 [Juncus effusus]|nr:hypothetical protein LUZ60_013738 [Juncus effusus]
MASYSFPELPAKEIAKVLGEEGIAAVTAADLAKPTAELVKAIFSSFFNYLDPLRNDSEGQIGFRTLQLLENPEHHAHAILELGLLNKIKKFFALISYHDFNLKDLIRPNPRDTIRHLSCVVNYIYYRNDKLVLLKPLLKELPNYDERKAQLTERIDEIKTEISNREMEVKMEEPAVKQVESEVRELDILIQSYNKQQANLKTEAKDLTDKIGSLNDKISKADFELMKQAQENAELESQIVQSPEKFQKALEEKKSAREEAKNAEKLLMQKVQKKTSDLETYTKANEKISKHLNKMQALQEQGNKNKAIEKEVKALKSELSDKRISLKTLEAQIVEKQGKVKQADEVLKTAEREKDEENLEGNKKINASKSEIQWKLNCLKPRERKAESIINEVKKLEEGTEAIRADGNAKQLQILSKAEEISKAFENYEKNITGPVVERAQKLEKQMKLLDSLN